LREKILSFFSFISEGVWDFSPNSPLAYIIYLGGITILCVFLIFYFAKKSEKQNKYNKNKEITLTDLLKIAANNKSSTADLLAALQLFNEKFVVAQNKEKSIEFFKKVLNHKNRHKSLFDYFHGSTLPKNITFKDELNKLEREALNK
jgi:sulfur carrier protein ThiS